MVGGRGRLIETFIIIILSSRKGVDDDDGRESYEVKREKELFIIIINEMQCVLRQLGTCNRQAITD